MSEPRPSDIYAHDVLVSTFGSAEQEVAAMCVVNYLAVTGDKWGTEFSWQEFVKWAETNAENSSNDLYRNLIRTNGGGFIIAGMLRLIERGFISRQDLGDATFFTAMPAFVEAVSLRS
jgi:hypothetical protein